MKPSQLLAAVVALSSVTAATSDAFDIKNAVADVKHVLFARQNNGDSPSTSAKKAATTDAPETTDKASQSDKASETEKPTVTKSDAKATGKEDSTGKASKSTKPTPTNFGPDVQPGTIAMITPNPILGPQYYKVGPDQGEWITFQWNYTSLRVTPKHIDILASCSVNQGTYTIAVNHTVQPTDGVVWDTRSYKKDHPNSPDFVTEMYTLLIYDSETSPTDAPKPGYLSPYNQFYFGLYEPRKPVAWKDFVCDNCLPNSAMSFADKNTLKVLFATSATTIASIMYFAASFGLW